MKALLNPKATEILEKHRVASVKHWGCYKVYWGAAKKQWGSTEGTVVLTRSTEVAIDWDKYLLIR